jgi:hypothetical protein
MRESEEYELYVSNWPRMFLVGKQMNRAPLLTVYESCCHWFYKTCPDYKEVVIQIVRNTCRVSLTSLSRVEWTLVDLDPNQWTTSCTSICDYCDEFSISSVSKWSQSGIWVPISPTLTFLRG